MIVQKYSNVIEELTDESEVTEKQSKVKGLAADFQKSLQQRDSELETLRKKVTNITINPLFTTHESI